MKYGSRNRSKANGKPLRRGERASWHINAGLNSQTATEGAGAAVAAPVNGVAASRLLTITGAIGNGQTVTVGGLTYTFQTVLTNVARNVLIGASDAIALDNLKAAVNGSAGAGATYAAATVVHPTVEATTNTDTTQLFVARTKGAAGNALTSTETLTNGSFPGGTFTGGVDGTEAPAGTRLYYNGYDYYTPTVATTSTATWVKSAQYTAP